MTRGPWLYLTTDAARGLVLVRGEGAAETVAAFARLGGAYASFMPLYSRWTHGWTVPLRFAGDLAAYTQSAHRVCVVSERREVVRAA
jgi:hypothetical protein